MVAGAAVAVQGMSRAVDGFHYTPTTIREWFKDPNTSTRSDNPAVDRIGRMPDLRAIAYKHMWIPPDVYVRDFVGDAGDWHEGFVGRSPDIIMRHARMTDPQAAFGEGSDTAEQMIGPRIGVTNDRYLYVRMRNRGRTEARDVRTRVYWAPLSTFILPSRWQLIGETVVGRVPPGNILTVSDAIAWDGDDMPGFGTFALIAVVDHPLDRFEPIADFGDAAIVDARIGWQNNVAHRTYEFLAYQESAWDIEPVMRLGLDIGGPPDIPRQFEIDLHPQLPRGSFIWVETQGAFAKSEGARAERQKSGQVRMQFKPNGRQTVGDVLLSSKAQPLQLFVHLPKGTKTSHEVSVSQLYKGQEVGRVTWRIMPAEKATKNSSPRKRAFDRH
jgi:serine protease